MEHTHTCIYIAYVAQYVNEYEPLEDNNIVIPFLKDNAILLSFLKALNSSVNETFLSQARILFSSNGCYQLINLSVIYLITINFYPPIFFATISHLYNQRDDECAQYSRVAHFLPLSHLGQLALNPFLR